MTSLIQREVVSEIRLYASVKPKKDIKRVAFRWRSPMPRLSSKSMYWPEIVAANSTS